ncbi:SOS response-associated peptidase [Brevibacillus massiliensis]|uniref:SOS response-associated peptidase n=1 Tax=Brevibacillus massiliensis TaxID=1118054 RepID=UPI0021C45C5E|nr:SOS response-associated peptidase [Brevibacillus massiliensis]
MRDRMPVILRKDNEKIWLDRERFDSDLLQSLLVPYEADLMRAYPVSPAVGSPKNDTPECVKEIV